MNEALETGAGASPPAWSRVESAVAACGLIVLGGFHPGEFEGEFGGEFEGEAAGVPALADARRAATLAIVGNAGPGMWRAFRAAPEAADGRPDPLNRWTERVLGAVAGELGAEVYFPFGGPPHHPFVAWAKRAAPVRESPLGMLIHPDYGLWHAYRGALAFAERLDPPPRDPRPRPCDDCAEKPCLNACPVEAFAPTGYGWAYDWAYDWGACAAHLARPEGADCLELGCRARRACPVGRDHLYEPGQAELHMRAFLRARRPGS